MLLSVIVPCFNEEAVLRKTHERLSDVLRRLDHLRFEIIYVDDGSQDRTATILTEIQANNREVKMLRLARNFGQQIAVSAGIEQASGDAVVLIDSDLQDPPEIIPEMVQLWLAGNDVVYGTRISREGESHFKLWTAKAFYRLINRLSETPIPIDSGDFRLMDRKVVDVLLSMPERDRFLRGMVGWIGFRQIALPYSRASRSAGESKYSFFKMLSFAMDGILSFSVLPLKLAVWTGLVVIWIALSNILIALFVRMFGPYDLQIGRGWASLFVAVLFIGGVQLVFLGIIGEYLGRIYTEVKRRPLYVVAERRGFENSEKAKSASQDRAMIAGL